MITIVTSQAIYIKYISPKVLLQVSTPLHRKQPKEAIKLFSKPLEHFSILKRKEIRVNNAECYDFKDAAPISNQVQR